MPFAPAKWAYAFFRLPAIMDEIAGTARSYSKYLLPLITFERPGDVFLHHHNGNKGFCDSYRDMFADHFGAHRSRCWDPVVVRVDAYWGARSHSLPRTYGLLCKQCFERCYPNAVGVAWLSLLELVAPVAEPAHYSPDLRFTPDEVFLNKKGKAAEVDPKNHLKFLKGRKPVVHRNGRLNLTEVGRGLFCEAGGYNCRHPVSLIFEGRSLCVGHAYRAMMTAEKSIGSWSYHGENKFHQLLAEAKAEPRLEWVFRTELKREVEGPLRTDPYQENDLGLLSEIHQERVAYLRANPGLLMASPEWAELSALGRLSRSRELVLHERNRVEELQQWARKAGLIE